jgi:hypothetical protein
MSLVDEDEQVAVAVEHRRRAVAVVGKILELLHRGHDGAPRACLE